MASLIPALPSEGGDQQQRNTANFKPTCVWGDQFLQYDSNSYYIDSQEMDLIAKVKAMLADDAGDRDTLSLVKLIDLLQRFGVAYHFKDEIDSHLSKLSESNPDLVEGRYGDDDLFMVSHLFRLLREHGYYVSSVKAAVVQTLVGMGDDITEDSFKWLFGNPHVLQSVSAASRFLDDIVGHKFELERGLVASLIHCIVKQYGCTEQEAEEMLRKWIFDSWKNINVTCLQPLAAPMPVLERILNWFRSMSVMYDEGTDNDTPPC